MQGIVSLIPLAGAIAGLASILSMEPGTLRTSFLAGYVLVIFAGGLAWLSLAVNLPSSWSILRTCKNLGIRRIHSTGKDGGRELSEHIANAQTIKIMAVSAQSLIKRQKREIVTALRDRRASVQVLLAAPDSEFLRDVEKSESPSRIGQIGPEIEQVEKLLSEYLGEALSDASQDLVEAAIEVAHYNTHLRSSLVLCDDNWGWLTLSLPPKRAVETASFELILTDQGLLRDCVSHFDRAWTLTHAVNQVRRIKRAEGP